MQAKLSKNSSQVDLLKELLNLQKDMVIMMLSMLEGEEITGIHAPHINQKKLLKSQVLSFRKRDQRNDRKANGWHACGICIQRGGKKTWEISPV